MKVMRCKKLGGRIIPKSCHVLNGRKDFCEDMFETEETKELTKANIEKFEL